MIVGAGGFEHTLSGCECFAQSRRTWGSVIAWVLTRCPNKRLDKNSDKHGIRVQKLYCLVKWGRGAYVAERHHLLFGQGYEELVNIKICAVS